jgi:putative addiction module component (TIGR02574 family)
MSTDLGRLAFELLGLPASSRAKLAKQLIASLDEVETPELDERALEIAERRARELAEGKVQGIPAEEVFRRLDEDLE